MNKILKKTLQGIVVASTILGTYTARDGDFPPIYSHKTKDCYGINVALYTKIDCGASINGANFSIKTTNYGKINGFNASLISQHKGTMNGINLNAFSFGDYFHHDPNGKLNGLDLNIFFSSNMKKVNGAQISLIGNGAENLNGFQIGLSNSAQSNGIILNVGIGDK